MLSKECGAPAIHDNMWQCFLRKDAPPDTKDVIPHDVAKLHCCQKVRKGMLQINTFQLIAHTFLLIQVDVNKLFPLKFIAIYKTELIDGSSIESPLLLIKLSLKL